VKDYTLGLKLPGAGGGGYLYMVAKSPEAAAKIKKILSRKSSQRKSTFRGNESVAYRNADK